MTFCWIDYETRSRVPIQLGTDRYMEGAEPLICTYAVGAAPTHCWDIVSGEPMPADLAALVASPDVTFVAHNAQFDRAVAQRLLRWDLPARRWHCTRVQAYSCGMPGSLETLAAVCGIPENDGKIKDGHRLIHLFCVPDEHGRYADRTTHPQDWELFKEYAVRDTDVLRKVHERLPAHNYQGVNKRWWVLDQYINERGFQFDDELALAAIKLLNDAKLRSDGAFSSATGGVVTAGTQRAKLLAWLNARGLDMPDLKAATVRDVLDGDSLDPVVRFLLEQRLEAAKASGAKYKKGLGMMGPGKRIRFAIQCNGAGRTGRSSGKGYQPHNMMRPTRKAKFVIDELIPALKRDPNSILNNPLAYDEPNTACANMLRSAITAAPGNTLYVADWSNIEGRLLAWFANEEWKLKAYSAGTDLYLELYSRFFGIDRSTLNRDSPERQVGKVVDLSCGYLGSVGAFVTMSAGYNTDLTVLPGMVIPKAKPENLKKAEKSWRRAILSGDDYGLERDVFVACHLLVQAYREANAAIYECGRAVGRAVIDAVREPGKLFEAARCPIWSTGAWLIIQLPSGRRLLYAQPRIHQEAVLDEETGKKAPKPREYLSFLTSRGKGMVREKAWPGLFMNNIVQGAANDVLRDAALAVHNDASTVPAIAYYLATLPEPQRTPISLHVHDELVLDVPKGSYNLERMIHLMVSSSPWAKGCPLAAEGWIGERYRK